MRYLVTGATGNVGSIVVDRLLARGERPRVFARNAEKASARWGDRVETMVGDFDDAASLSAALSGVDVLFLVTMGHELHVHDVAATNVAKAAGVKRLVKLSTIDARQQNVGTGVWHARGEAAIRASGITFTFVQPSGFMTNALYWAKSIKAEGVVRTATGEGRIPFIHSDDIADVATKALTTRDHDGESLPITGPDALSYREMADVIGAALGRPLRFQSISEEEAREQQVAWGAPPPMVEARLSIFRAIRDGRLAQVTDTVERVLGRRPLTFAHWARENTDVFR